jgi:predicted transcriptional regulator
MNEDDWTDDPQEEDARSREIQKVFAEMERNAKKALHYLVLEGFVKPTDTPGVYEYTPEGLVLAQKQYKKMQDDGLI